MEVESEETIAKRWDKKKDSLKTFSQNIQRLRRRINEDLKSENEKDFLTALVVAIMLKSSERVGNEDSANGNGHFGVTGFKKSHIQCKDGEILLDYKGKSGVDHKKTLTNKRLCSCLQKAIDNSPSKRVFTTSDGFDIKSDRVNRYLTDFGVTSKDIRGYSANILVYRKLNRLTIEPEEKDRKKQFIKAVKEVAEHVGHGSATLQKHYLIPELKPIFIEKGKVVSIDENKFKNGGEVNNNNMEKKTEEPKSVGIAFIWNKHILLVHHPKAKGVSHSMSIPKGHVEGAEAGTEALTAIREVKEEVGIDVPVAWLADEKIHTVHNANGRAIQYYILHIKDLKDLGLSDFVVPQNQCQKEEVARAMFMTFENAWNSILRYQRPILEQAGYEPSKVVSKSSQDYIDYFYESVQKKFVKDNPLFEVFLDGEKLVFYGYGNSVELDFIPSFIKTEDGVEFNGAVLSGQDISISIDKDLKFDKDIIIDKLKSGRMDDGGEIKDGKKGKKDEDGFYKIDDECCYKDDEKGNPKYTHLIFGEGWSVNLSKRYTMYPQSQEPIKKRKPIAIAVTGRKLMKFYDAYDGYVVEAKKNDKEWISDEAQSIIDKKAKTKFENGGESGYSDKSNYALNKILNEADPFINKVYEDRIKWLEMDNAKKGRPALSNFDKEYVKLSLVFDLIKAIGNYIDNTDEVSNLTTSTSEGVISISANIKRDSKDYYFSTRMIIAGGHNIQIAHYRYIVDTNLPRKSINVESDKIKKELSNLTKIQRLQKELTHEKKRLDNEILKRKEKLKLSDEDIYKLIDEEKRGLIETQWGDLSSEAKTNYDNDKNKFDASQLKYKDSVIKSWKTIKIPSEERIKSLQKLVDRTSEKLEKLNASNNPDIKYNDGGEIDDFEKSKESIIFKENNKDEPKHIISGEIENREGNIIQTITDHLRKSKRAGTSAKGFKQYREQEEDRLKDFISKNNLWISPPDAKKYLSEGAEQKVYLINDNNVVKVNSSIYYSSWEDYLNSLTLHNHFFTDTPYGLLGFVLEDDKAYSVVKQPYIEKTDDTDLELVKQFITQKGFINVKNNDYYNEELGVILEDLHEENVLTRDNHLYFIDTVFYVDNDLPTKLEMGGIIEGQLHSQCNDETGCGEKFEVGDSGRVIEAERDEAVIVSESFKDDTLFEIHGTLSQIASGLNVIGGGKNFDKGAKIMGSDGNLIEFSEMKSEATNTDVEDDLEGGSIIINRRSMADPKKYTVSGTARQIASEINSIDGNGKIIEKGGDIVEK